MPRPFWPPAARSDDSLCRRLRQEQKQADLAEYRRLLYVAMTRAEDRLYICGAGKDEPGEDSWYSLVRGGLAPLAQEFDLPWGKGLRLGDEPPAFHGHTVPAPEKGASADSSFAFLLNPAPAEPSPPQPLAPSRPGGDEPAAASPLDGGHAYARGNLVHRLLQYLPDMEEAKRVAAAEKIAVTHGKGLPGDVVRECISQALAVMAAPRYAFLFGPQALAEVPVAGCVEMEGRPVAVAGQIDRLHVGASEVWIVDFKSNRRPPGPGEAIPAAYLRQMRLYRLLLQQIYPDKTVRCALLWTASAMLTPLDEAQLDEAPASSYI